MTANPEFGVDVAQNHHLARGAELVEAIITVTATPAEDTDDTAGAAEVIMLDCSASMHRPSKLAAAKRAASAAIDALRDDTGFAVVAGNDLADMIYPAGQRLATASPAAKEDAKQAVAGLRANGGTAMGRWLRMANELFAEHVGGIKHAILLTDGRNTSEPPAELATTLKEVADNFVCDCRGVGTDWEVSELRRIADTLLGTVDIVAEPNDLAADFAAMTEKVMRKQIADVRLRLWTPVGAEVTFVKQVDPALADLTDRRSQTRPQQGDYPTGSWGAETRAYHVQVRVPAAGVGDRMLACRISVVAGDTVLGSGKILATWTDDTASYGALDPRVAHYTGQAELAEAIAAGLQARKDGDLDTATAKLGRAVALATESGHEETTVLLSKVVDIEDPMRGTVRIKPAVAMIDEMTLDTRSTVTKRMHARG